MISQNSVLEGLVVFLIRKSQFNIIHHPYIFEFRCYVKLVEWKEGGYSPFNKPYPQGEIWCGGNMVTHGYYEMPEKTAEDFHTDENGIRWFKTGDIGQFDEDGSLRIIGESKMIINP